jgi:hypothetical protein
LNWKDLEKLTSTDQSDKNGTTKETKEKDLKKKEKLPRKTTDLLKYLNVLPNHYFFFIIFMVFKISFLYG